MPKKEDRKKTQDFFTVPITPENAEFEDDVHYPADSDEWKKFAGDSKYSGEFMVPQSKLRRFQCFCFPI